MSVARQRAFVLTVRKEQIANKCTAWAGSSVTSMVLDNNDNNFYNPNNNFKSLRG